MYVYVATLDNLDIAAGYVCSSAWPLGVTRILNQALYVRVGGHVL